MSLRAAIVCALAVTAIAACSSDVADTVGTTALVTTSASTTATISAASSPNTTIPVTTTQPTTTTTNRPAFDFPGPDSTDGWQTTNDTVMGGVSSGQSSWADGMLVFTGELSLANGGGFASIRSPAIDPQVAIGWAGRTGVRVQVEGDGRSWTVEVRTDEESAGWITSVPTSPDGLTDTELAWTSFEPVTRFLEPRQADEPLDPARIVSVAFYLVDGLEGPFRLGVRSIA